MKKVAFIDTVHPILQEKLEAKGWQCDDLTSQSVLELKENLIDYHGIVVRSRYRMDADLLDKAHKLEFIARSGAGMENIDVPFCNSRNITLFNAPEGNRNAVGEHALGMLLSLFNKLNKGDSEIRRGIWDREGNRGVELDGRTVGIIGYGNNGAAFARKLRGFDVRVLAYDKYKSGFGNGHVEEVTLAELQKRATVISLHIPQNAETIGLIDAAFIQEVENPFYLINLARGKIVDTEALMQGLIKGEILGACLDVLEYEKSSFENMFDQNKEMPEAMKFLVNSNKTILSPHVGGWTVESYYKLSAILYDKIAAHYNFK
ncbi:NAD(P)-dependent oxidoreductase [Crocinitomix algicola]|uniref:NAD(P)-dependent oxidoreductase n=1 Tax=Crocinitomix algicola TaxID=1740263 RepID=UPI00083141A5|nr:NAD(P)-dependent oxidoreductase [Crocinitomix algicola]